MLNRMWNYFFTNQRKINLDSDIDYINAFAKEDLNSDIDKLFLIARAAGNGGIKSSITRLSEYIGIDMKLMRNGLLNELDNLGLGLIHHASGSEKFIQFLIDNKSNLNLKIKTNEKDNGSTALHLLICAGINRDNIINLLINNGADVNTKDANGNTPIHSAAATNVFPHRNYNEGIKILLDNGADINELNNDNKTALDIAIERNQKELAEFLVTNSAKTSKQISEEDKAIEKEIKNFIDLGNIESKISSAEKDDISEDDWIAIYDSEKSDEDLGFENVIESKDNGTVILFSKGITKETTSDSEFSEILKDFEVPSIKNNHTEDKDSSHTINSFVSKLGQAVYKGIFSSLSR